MLHSDSDLVQLPEHCYKLQNCIQNYAWGSHESIAQLLGKSVPSETPEAELWMGAHPKAPSSLQCTDGRQVTLQDWIQQHPVAILGLQHAEQYAHKLPFLFKVLAAAQPLSIQAHPNKEQARQGYALENQKGIPLSARHRNYRDDNHKPELICALTPFWALKGFLSTEDIIRYFRMYGVQAFGDIERFFTSKSPSNGLQSFFEYMMRASSELQARATREALEKAQQGIGPQKLQDWIQKLYSFYPDDIGVLSPLYLHLTQLQPGEALYLGAGELHAYLEGTGIELMANSDNVLRGGLTPKHIDVEELLSVLHFEPTPLHPQQPQQHTSANEWIYTTPAPEFVLSRLQIQQEQTYVSAYQRSVELLLCTEGSGQLLPTTGPSYTFQKGDVLLIPASQKQYTLQGQGHLYKAALPL